MMNKNNIHVIQGRKVAFDFNHIAKHWVPNDPLSTHFLNAAHIILPAGEFWFCRVFNQALPFIHDEKLKADVKGFIRQEAIHGRTHEKARLYFKAHEIHVDAFTQQVNFIFERLLGDKPLGLSALKWLIGPEKWLRFRLGMIAGVEHYTGVVGQWSLDNTSLDAGDPTMVDLFRWHLAEEVEHRNVAFDLLKAMYDSDFKFQMTKNIALLVALPLLASLWMRGTRQILNQDQEAHHFAKMSRLRLLFETEKIAHQTDHLPKISHLLKATLRWFHPKFHPEFEGNTEQALAYLARSPSVQNAMEFNNIKMC